MVQMNLNNMDSRNVAMLIKQVYRSRFYFCVMAVLCLQASCSSNNTVMICVSPTAHKYHSTRCKGVKACTHQIKKLTIKEAEELGKTPCGYCY